MTSTDSASSSSATRWMSADPLRRLADHVTAMIAYWDADQRCVFANRAYEHWFARDPETMPGMHIRELLGETLYALNRPYIEAALRGERQEFERNVPDPHGGPARPSLAEYIPDVVDGVVRGFFVLVTDVSALKRAERELAASRERLAGIVEIAADAIISVSEDGRIFLFNHSAEAMFGWQRAEVMGKPLDILIPERLHARHRDDVRGFATSDVTSRRMAADRPEVVGVRKDGREFAAEASVSHLVLEGKSVLTVSVRDISDQLRAEHERQQALARLRESEERLRLVIDEAPIGMALVALDGRLTRVNSALCEIVGRTPEELERLTIQALAHGEDLDADAALVARLTRGEVPRYQLEKMYIRKDGSLVPVLLHVSVQRDLAGAPLSYIAQIEDISQQKRLENEQRFLARVGPLLAQQSLDLDATLRTIADVTVEQFADFCNVELVEDGPQLRRLVFASRPELRHVADVLAQFPRDRTRPRPIRAAVDARRSTLIPQVTETMMQAWAESDEHLAAMRAAGIASVLIVPLLAQDRAVGAIALTASTASKRRFDERDMVVAEELARNAAIAIENARLYHTAQQATAARDEILGIVAHDLRNPLAACVFQVPVLRRAAASNPRLARAAQTLERATTRMNRLIEDLLDVTRLDAGRMSIEPAALSPAALVAEACDAHRAAAVDAGIALASDVAPDLPAVSGDRDRLLQVMENLIGNALKFTSHNGTITVCAKPDRDGVGVSFSVADTGDGIAAEELPHLFDRFWQGRQKKRGAGLGLSIVKGIVEAHGGRIWVESTPGAGSTFCFTIPRRA